MDCSPKELRMSYIDFERDALAVDGTSEDKSLLLNRGVACKAKKTFEFNRCKQWKLRAYMAEGRLREYGSYP